MDFLLQFLFVRIDFRAKQRSDRVAPEGPDDGEEMILTRGAMLADPALRRAKIRAGNTGGLFGSMGAIALAQGLADPFTQRLGAALQFPGIQNLDLHVSQPP